MIEQAHVGHSAGLKATARLALRAKAAIAGPASREIVRLPPSDVIEAQRRKGHGSHTIACFQSHVWHVVWESRSCKRDLEGHSCAERLEGQSRARAGRQYGGRQRNNANGCNVLVRLRRLLAVLKDKGGRASVDPTKSVVNLQERGEAEWHLWIAWICERIQADGRLDDFRAVPLGAGKKVNQL